MQGITFLKPLFRPTAQQHLGIRMARVAQDLAHRRFLDDPPGVHHRHPVGDLHRGADIVGHKHDRQPALLLLLAQQDQDLDLHRGVEGGGRLIRQQQLRVTGERKGDHRPLAHPAGHLVRVSIQPPLRAGNAHLAQGLQRPVPGRLARQPFVAAQPFNNLLPDGVDRIEGQQRLLKNHRAASAAIAPQLAGAHRQHLVVPHLQGAGELTAPWRVQAHQRPQGHALAGTRLANQRHHLPLLYLKGDPVDRVDGLPVAAKDDPQVAHMDKGVIRHG